MHVLITGGTGFIGSRLALHCRELGQTVRVMAQRNTPAECQNCQELENSNIQIIDGSVMDIESLRSAAENVEVVYHLAAAQHEANVPDQHFYNVNVEGTRNVLQAAVDTNVKRFVHGSTIGVYGSSHNDPVSENSSLEPDNIYGVTKLAGEKVVQHFFEKLPISIIRIAEVYGPGDRRLLKLFRGIQKGTFFMIGKGTNLHHPIYVDDLIDGMKLAATINEAVGKTFVLAGPKAITTNEMVLGIAKALDTKGPTIRVPLWPLLATAIGMETLLQPLGIQPPLHRRRMNFFIKSFKFNCSEAQSIMDFQPKISFEQGAKFTAQWYRSKDLI
ncbi:MAG: NAD(P)-dependent oxidoreductase [Pirellulales bacterium]